jgi:VanZ family protein
MLRYRSAWLGGGWLLVTLVSVLSLMPNPPEPFTFSYFDKVEHGMAYAALSWWFCQLYLGARQRVVLALIAMGVVIEILQGLSGYRYFEYADMLANSTGVLLGFLWARSRYGRVFIFIENGIRSESGKKT